MKKFAVWGVAVCAAVAAQAASFLWHNDAAISNSDGVYAGGGTAYLIDGADGHGGISQSSLFDMIKGGETISWNDYTFYSATLDADGKSFTSLMDGGDVVPAGIVSGSAQIEQPYATVQYKIDRSSGYKMYDSGVGEQFLNSGDFYSVIVAGDGNYYFSEVTSVSVSGEGTTDVKFSNTVTGAFAAGAGGWYNATAVPEPTSGLLMLVGLGLLGLRRKRRE